MNTLTAATISNAPLPNPASDFDLLRQEGIRWIQQLAGATWTDYNTHDPGITILDQLCYAITDLGYRLDHDIRELLATQTGNPYESLFSAAEILTVNPVTLTDLRKLILDVRGVKNGWIEKQTQTRPALYYYPDEKTLNLFESEGKRAEPVSLQGLYQVMIEKEPDADAVTVFNAVTGRLHGCRNLCEDFDTVRILEPVPVRVSGVVEVGRTDDIEKLAAGVLFRIARFISPRLRFYTLAGMLEKGKSPDEIFEGPALEHGFLDDTELQAYTRKTSLYTSDIIREMMDEPGVSYVSSIGLSPGAGPSGQNWQLDMEEGKTPVFDFDNTCPGEPGRIAGDDLYQNAGDAYPEKYKLVFKKNGVQLAVSKTRVRNMFDALDGAWRKQPLKQEDRNIIPQQLRYRPLHTYYSIQNHFPLVYGIGEAGLPASASPLREAQAQQLKAYLLFFEQILASYHAQTAGLKELFSFFNPDDQMYFCQSVKDIVPGAKQLFKPVADITEEGEAAYAKSGEETLQRKNRLLDHLLARFGENATKYALHLYSYQARYPNESLLDGMPAPGEKASGKRHGLKKLVNDKLNFLANYPRVSNERGRAFNYKKDSWNTDNVSGLERRIAAKLGIGNCTRRFLADGSKGEEGFHLLEHILLRPVQEDIDVLAPYSIPHDIERTTGVTVAGENRIECRSPAHGLQSGDRVIISRSAFDGTYEVTNVLPDTFQIRSAYNVKADAVNTAQWRRDVAGVNASVLTFTQPITGFAQKSTDNLITVCTAPAHQLTEGDTIEIIGTKSYNGTYTVSNVIPVPPAPSGTPGSAAVGSFEIARPFNGQNTNGRFVKTGVHPDPYSLQLTCMFPGWIGRFADGNFRVFVENTVREETPAHLTVYIRWLREAEMKSFEKFFGLFLSKLKS